MGKRRRTADQGSLAPGLGIAGGIVWGYHLYQKSDWISLAAMVFAAFAVLGIWLLFLRGTRCGYPTRQYAPCRLRVRGALRGCEKFHKGLKAEAAIAYVGHRHPRDQLQRIWLSHAATTRLMSPVGGPPLPEPNDGGRRERPRFEITMVLATVGSALASVVMPVIQMLLGSG